MTSSTTLALLSGERGGLLKHTSQHLVSLLLVGCLKPTINTRLQLCVLPFTYMIMYMCVHICINIKMSVVFGRMGSAQELDYCASLRN